MEPHFASDEGRRCDGCGESARPNKDGRLTPLRRCSRCRNVFYHDAHCQRMHYPVHRKFCHAVASAPASTTMTQGASDVWSVVERPRRGRCVIATRSLPANFRLGTSKNAAVNPPPFFPPLAIPVLNRSYRHERCALCFGRLTDSPVVLWEHPVCPILICSSECRHRSSKSWLLEHELSCLRFLYGGAKQLGPPTVLPTALLMFCIFLETKRDKQELDRLLSLLQAHESIVLSEDAAIHQEAVVRTVQSLCQALLQISPSLQGEEKFPIDALQHVPDTNVLRQLWDRIKYNAFTITDDSVNGSNEPVGIGLYQSPAHYFNHSCCPNAIQSFEFKAGEPPRLCLQTSRSIALGEEICIRYCEDISGQSRDERRKQLYEQYNFWCDCELCHSS